MKQWKAMVVSAVLLAGCESNQVGEAALGEMASEIAAKPKIDFGELTYGGTGCSQGSVDSKLKSKSLDVEFEELGISGSDWRAVCNLALPFTAKAGYQLGLGGINLWATIDPHNDATIRLAKLFPGQDGQKIVVDWPPSDEDEEAADSFDTVWSDCGEDSIARWSMEVRSPKDHATVDLIEASLKFQVRACDE